MTSSPVDLRSEFHDVRAQGARASCLCCAATALHEHGRKTEMPLSVEYLFYQAVQQGGSESEGVRMDQLSAAIELEGQPLECEWPYNSTPQSRWRMPENVGVLWRAALAIRSSDVAHVIDNLRAGRPVILGLAITAQFFSPPPDAPIQTIDPDPERGLHAVLGIGVKNMNDATCVLIRNSWGAAWGEGGHAWLHEEYLARQLIELAVLKELL